MNIGDRVRLKSLELLKQEKDFSDARELILKMAIEICGEDPIGTVKSIERNDDGEELIKVDFYDILGVKLTQIYPKNYLEISDRKNDSNIIKLMEEDNMSKTRIFKIKDVDKFAEEYMSDPSCLDDEVVEGITHREMLGRIRMAEIKNTCDCPVCKGIESQLQISSFMGSAEGRLPLELEYFEEVEYKVHPDSKYKIGDKLILNEEYFEYIENKYKEALISQALKDRIEEDRSVVFEILSSWEDNKGIVYLLKDNLGNFGELNENHVKKIELN